MGILESFTPASRDAGGVAFELQDEVFSNSSPAACGA